MKILEPRGEAEAPLWTTEGLSWEGLPYRGLKEKFNFDGTAAAPRKAQCYGRESHSRPTVSPVGKDNPRWAPSFPSIMGCCLGSSLRPHPTKVTGGTCKAWPLAIRDREGVWGLQRPMLRSWLTAFLLAVVPEERSQPTALPTCRAKLWSPWVSRLSGQFCLIWIPS